MSDAPNPDLRPWQRGEEDRRVPPQGLPARRSTLPKADLIDWIDAILGGVCWVVLSLSIVFIFGVL